MFNDVVKNGESPDIGLDKDRLKQMHLPNVKVLMYHQVSDRVDICKKFWICVHTTTFEEHLVLLKKKGYVSITFKDHLLALQGKKELPPKSVIITFDGYEDVYTHAYPLLKKHGMKAVIFVLGNRKIKTNIWDEYLNYPVFNLLNDDQIREMHENGIEIGTHSVNHKNLTDLSDGLLWNEIYESKQRVEDLISSSVITFSYPYGAINDYVKEKVKEAEYHYACSVSKGKPFNINNPFEIVRIPILNITNNLFMKLRLMTPFEYYISLRNEINSTFFKRNSK